MPNILVVEDHAALRDALAIAINAKGMKAVTAARGDNAVKALETQSFDLVVTDLKLPGCSGLEVLKAARANQPQAPVLIMTAHGTMESVIEALRLGALDFIEKPFDIDEMETRIEKALQQGNLVETIRGLRENILAPYKPDNIIGESPALLEVLAKAQKIASAKASVLVTGETGTGKELLAGAVHAQSPRTEAEFVAVNCAAIPDALLESELFGHERGAFTGAARRRIGKFERANKGSLFLDEIGDMSMATQAKILRVLQDGRLDRVGGDESLEVDVRVIAATHRNLSRAVSTGEFREDLYYRLNVIHLHMPPLRERDDDVILLARHFAAKYSADLKRPMVGFSEAAISALKEHSWPGNVRELRNAVERAVLLTEGDVVDPMDLGLEHVEKPLSENNGMEGDKFKFILPQSGFSLKDAERELILSALKRSHWVQKNAAKSLGITKRAMHYKIEQHGITHPAWAKNRPKNVNEDEEEGGRD